MKNVVKAMCLIALSAALFAAGCSRQKPGSGGSDGSANSGSIQIKGSDTMVNLGQAWAEEFMKKHSGASVAVTGGGSGTGIAAMINGSTDIAESSRAFKDEEMAQAEKAGVKPHEIIVGYDGIAVAVNPGNPVSSLTVDQLADIFTGRVTDWSEIGGDRGKIVVLSREVNSGTHVYFKEHVLNKGDSTGNEEFTTSAMLMPSSQAIADELAQNKDAIGYFGMGYISDKTKTVAIAAKTGEAPVKPSIKTVLSKTYPISRPLFMYTNGVPKGLAKDFIDFALSAEGQEIVKKLDFVPLAK